MSSKVKSNGVSRRDVLAGATAVGAMFLPSRVLGRGGAMAPSEKMNVGVVGIGTRGGFDLKEIANLQHNIVAVCDVDWRTAKGRQYPTAFENAAGFPNAKRYSDWRIMLQEQDKALDAVLVATADHCHALIALHAMKMGKHVFTEKPLCHTIEEARLLMAYEKKYKVTTQTGCQGHSSEDCRMLVERVKDGMIGDVREVHLFQSPPRRTPRPAPQAANAAPPPRRNYADMLEAVKQEHPIDSELNWDVWIGPAPHRNFNPMYTPISWRNWQEFGEGNIGDYCCHSFDPVFWSLDLKLPEQVVAQPDLAFDPAANDQTWPFSGNVRWDFPARGKMPPVSVFWHYGQDSGHIPLPKGWNTKDDLPSAGGGILYGSQGAVVFGPIFASLPLTASTGAYKPVTWGTPTKIRYFPEELEKTYKVKKPLNLPRPFNHWADWLDSAKAGKPAGAGFSYGGLMTETALVGVIGFSQPGKLLRYDPAAGKFINNDEANADRLMKRVAYRKGFELPT